jgi:hypothetical protein
MPGSLRQPLLQALELLPMPAQQRPIGTGQAHWRLPGSDSWAVEPVAFQEQVSVPPVDHLGLLSSEVAAAETPPLELSPAPPDRYTAVEMGNTQVSQMQVENPAWVGRTAAALASTPHQEPKSVVIPVQQEPTRDRPQVGDSLPREASLIPTAQEGGTSAAPQAQQEPEHGRVQLASPGNTSANPMAHQPQVPGQPREDEIELSTAQAEGLAADG